MSNPPRFRTSRSTAHPGVTLYALPGSSSTTQNEVSADPTSSGGSDVMTATTSFTLPAAASTSSGIALTDGYTTLRRTIRSIAVPVGSTTTIKDEHLDEIEIAAPETSGSITTPSKRARTQSKSTATVSPSTSTPKRPRRSDPTTPKPDHADDVDTKPSLTPTPIKKTPKKPLPLAPLEKAHKAPERWEVQYKIIERMRGKIVAPVDTMGCERPDLPDLSAPALPILPTDMADPKSTTSLDTPHLPALPSTTPTLPSKTQRFHTLISLMLSSQTKDAITAAAINNLHSTLSGGLTCSSLAEADRQVVEGCICKVGFWRRKAEYIQLAARDLLERNLDEEEEGDISKKGDGDVPKTIEGLCKLKGVGPKMAFLALQCAWNINAGIGVDVHVHRITNRLKWHRPPTITAEQTRVNLESWLPKELHKGINPMLVGFGQTICLPVGPRCDICLLGTLRICPSRISNVRTAGRKAVEWKFDIADIEDLLPMISKITKVKEEEGVEGLVKLEDMDGFQGVNQVQAEDVVFTVKVEDA